MTGQKGHISGLLCTTPLRPGLRAWVHDDINKPIQSRKIIVGFVRYPWDKFGHASRLCRTDSQPTLSLLLSFLNHFLAH